MEPDPAAGRSTPSRRSAPDSGLLLPSAILSWTNHWIAVDKPAGLPSRPGPGHPSSVLSLLEDWLRREFSGEAHPGVVHRLDRDTSGVLLFSLGPQAHRALTAAFAERRIRKEYMAVVSGWPHPRRGLIDLPLRRDASGRSRPDTRGLAAATRYTTLRRYRDATLLAVQPLTGRMHQIRAHLAARGHPVLGDRTYGRGTTPGGPGRAEERSGGRRRPGGRSQRARPPRLCLHAKKLLLPASLLAALGPVEDRLAPGRSGTFPADEALLIMAPEPADLRRFLVSLTGGAHGG